MLTTQEMDTVQSFQEVLRRYAPDAGDDVMTYVHRIGKCIFRFQKSP